MCGIAGYKVQRRPLPDSLDAMVEALVHRGPDGSGFYRTDGYTAGMRRLSINDVEGGDQPLYNEDESVVLLYNGEIYNSPALRQALEREGHVFRTHSDGEVICHLYEKVGERCFEWLDGMFAVALWDVRRRRLILARDVPGEKPLYYAKLPGNGVVFASEIKSLRRYPLPDFSLNYQALWDFPTFLWIPEPETVYAGVCALMPSHILIADDAGIAIHKYSFRDAAVPVPTNDDDLLLRTREVVEEAVKSRLLSDVPVGSFLSSGLDSSIIASIAARELPELTTFTIGFEDIADPYHGRADEAAAAAEYARRLGTKHHTIRVTASDFGDALSAFCDYGDQPFSVSSGLGILCVARAARQAGIKVLLSGDGADECFGGYSWYAYLKDVPEEYTELTSDDEGAVISFQNIGLDITTRTAALHRYDAHRRAWAWHYYASEAEKKSLFAPDAFVDSTSSLRFFRAYNPDTQWRPEDFVAQDRRFYFPNEMLRKVDRMTMACSVEGRAPFAAPKVLAFADALDYSAMYREGMLKWALRRAFADLLPEDVLSRPKHGFNVPVDHWLRTGWNDLLRHSFSSESALYKHGLIHSGSEAVVQRLLDDTSRLHGHTLFSYIMLNMWLEKNG